MKLAIGCDHGGIILKPAILQYLSQQGIDFKDYGCFSTESVDYPEYAYKVATAVSCGECDKGILLCGTGIGMSIAANKIHGIRAAVVSDEFCAAKCAEHNAANVLCLGGRVIDSEKAVQLVDIWLNTPFAGGRHAERVKKFMSYEDEGK